MDETRARRRLLLRAETPVVARGRERIDVTLFRDVESQRVERVAARLFETLTIAVSELAEPRDVETAELVEQSVAFTISSERLHVTKRTIAYEDVRVHRRVLSEVRSVSQQLQREELIHEGETR